MRDGSEGGRDITTYKQPVALRMVHALGRELDLPGVGVIHAVKLDHPFKLVVEVSAYGPPQGDAGDYIVLHPNGSLMILSAGVVERHFPTGGAGVGKDEAEDPSLDE